MRFVIAAVLFILSSALILLGLAQRTILAPPSEYSATVSFKQKAPYVVIPNDVLAMHPGTPTITAKNEGPAFVAIGRESDIVAFVGKSPNLVIGVEKKSDKLSNTFVPGYEASINPTNSDLWRGENSAPQSASLKASTNHEGAALVASDGVSAAPSTVEILWKVAVDFTVSNILIWIGLGLLLVAAILTFLTYRRMRINRGPRRKTPKAPKPPKYRYRSTIAIPKRGRRSARSFTAITSIGITLALLTGCTPSLNSASPSPEASVEQLDQVSLLAPQIKRIITDVAIVANDADTANDKRILVERFSGPALQVRDINYQLRQKNKRIAALPAIVGEPIRFSLPAATTVWPRQLMVVTDEEGEAALPQMLVLQQDNPRSNYKVWFTSRLMPGAKIPAVPSADIGAIPVDDESLFLKVQPKNIPTTFGDVLNFGAASLSAPLFDLDNEFYKQVSQAQKAQATQLNTANISYTHKLGDANVVSLATSDGGALVAVYQTDVYTIKPKRANSAVGVSGQEAILLGANGSTRGVQSTYGDMLFFYVPPVDDKSKIKLIGATQGLISVQEFVMAEDLNARLRGAMDLSSLNKKNDSENQAVSSISLELPSLIVEITEANLRTYLEISTRAPLVIDFYSGSTESLDLSAKLEKLVAEAKGAFLLGRIDVQAHARVAEAFSVQQGATAIAVLKGQPFPLFEGNVELEQITMVISKLLEVAAGNGVTERITVNENAQAVSSAPKLPKHHQEAADALNAGDNQKALELYQQILRESPADALAAAGLAQTELLLRVDGLDFEKVLDNSPQNFEELMTFADALIAIGDFAVGFDALLTNYQEVSAEEQQLMKERLLKYFEIVGKTDPTVVSARARLTSMLF